MKHKITKNLKERKEMRAWLVLAWICVFVASLDIHDYLWIVTTLPALTILAFFIGRLSDDDR
jgi:hypothetical protein